MAEGEDLMSYEDNSRLFTLKCDSKRGRVQGKEDIHFVQRMLEKYPKQFKEIEASVFEETKPFGSR